MTRIIWTPHKNTERQAVRVHGNCWFLMQSENDRLLISSSGNHMTGDLRWIFGDQVIACC